LPEVEKNPILKIQLSKCS